MPSKNIYFPLEIVDREYPGKIALASEAVFRGFTAVIGHKGPVTELALMQNHGGIYFYKSALPITGWLEQLRNKGFALVAQDEEGGFLYDRFEDFLKTRPSLAHSKDMDRFFCWGKSEYDFLVRTFAHESVGSHPYRLTGSPRTVWWGEHGHRIYASQVSLIRQRFGSFVLFATNFGSANSYLSKRQLLRHSSQFSYFDRDSYLNQMKKDQANLDLFVRAIDRLKQENGKSIVIRPHPSENVEFWKRRFADSSNIFIESDGSVTPWVLAAKVLVHNESSTGLEAAVSGVKTFALGNVADMFSSERSLPNRLSEAVGSAEGLVHALKKYEAESDDSHSVRKLPSSVDHNLHGAGTVLPVLSIMDEIDNLVTENIACDVLSIGVLKSIRRRVLTVAASSFFGSTARGRMEARKRPALSLKDVQRDVVNALAVLSREANVVFDQPSSGVVIIRSR